MTFSLREHGIRTVALDIEGTTTPLAFVSDVLFPFARAHLRRYLRDQIDGPGLGDIVAGLRAEREEDLAGGKAPPPLVAGYVEWLIDHDRKSSALKLLQGRLWERGYRSGVLKGDVFDDVPPALARWRAAAVGVAIYSSGSVLAQQLLFGTTVHGDLTPLIDAYFPDTAVGPKTSPDSYRRITEAVQCPPGALLFISDARAELAAARSAGCQTAWCVRTGTRVDSQPDERVIIRTFDELVT